MAGRCQSSIGALHSQNGSEYIHIGSIAPSAFLQLVEERIAGSMYDPEDPDPLSKRRAIAIEYWLLTALVAGSLLYGLYTGVRGYFAG
jgi:hypothetical protein